MARRSLPRAIRLANIASKRPKKALRVAGKQTLKLGSKAFTKMFPQLGALMNGKSSSSLAANQNGLSAQMYNSSFSQILENQNKQNDILNQILQQIRGSNINFSNSNLINPLNNNQNNNGIPGLDFTDIPIPDSRDLERRRATRSRPSRWRRFIKFIRRRSPALFRRVGVKLLRSAGLALVPVAGWAALALTIGLAAYDLVELANLWQEFTSTENTTNEMNNEEDDEDISEEEEYSIFSREQAETYNRENLTPVDQLGETRPEEVTPEEQTVLDASRVESQRRRDQAGITENLEDLQRQRYMEEHAQAQRDFNQNNTLINRNRVTNTRTTLENYNRNNPISETDTSRIQQAPSAPVSVPGINPPSAPVPAISNNPSLPSAPVPVINIPPTPAISNNPPSVPVINIPPTPAISNNPPSVPVPTPAPSISNNIPIDTNIEKTVQNEIDENIPELIDEIVVIGKREIANKATEVNDASPINKNSIIALSSKEFEKINFEARLIKFESTETLSKSIGLDATQNPGGIGNGFSSLRNITGLMGSMTGDGRATNGSAARALEFFQSKGWSLAQAAGIVANLDIETGGTFNPAAVGDGGKAYGIAQWHPDRQAHFESWAGRSIRGSTFEQQLEFVNFELTQGREKRAGNRIRQTTTPQEAAAVTDQFYERSDGTARMRRIQRAITLAGNATQNATQTASSGGGEETAPAAQAATQTPSTGASVSAAGAAPSGNQNPATPTEHAHTTGTNLAQAGTDMVAADQKQTLDAMNPVNVQQQSQTQPQQQTSQPNQQQVSSNDIPLRIRLESAFDYRQQ